MTQPVLADLGTTASEIREQAAVLLHASFNHPMGWPTLASAREEVTEILARGFALAQIEGGRLLGWIGGLPEYHGKVWELHPLVVQPDVRRRGIGRRLVRAFEGEAAARGALTITLGTDDDQGVTSLADVDLYSDLPKHLAGITDLGHEHPFGFYRKLGFTVTGVMPDANGPGRPDIFMSKRIRANR